MQKFGFVRKACELWIDFVLDINERIADERSRLVIMKVIGTLGRQEIKRSVWLAFPSELSKHVVSEIF
jgi:histone H2B